MPNETDQDEETTTTERWLPRDGACSVLPLPKAMYACGLCREENTWPADDLYWCRITHSWICGDCWDEERDAERGVRLDREIERQNAAGRAPRTQDER